MSDNRAVVLLVDDMQENLMLLSNILRDEYHIKVAKTGEKALEIANKYEVDLILLDVVMPKMGGYEVCERLQANKKTSNIPVIFVTANTSLEDEEKGFSMGAVDYIIKPYAPSTVISRVKTHVQLQHKREELEEKNEKLKSYINLIDKNIITSSTNLLGDITYVSQAFCDISGYSKEELLGQNHRIVKHPDFDPQVYVEIWETITADKTWQGEIKNLKKNGRHYWVKATISPTYDKHGKKNGYTAIRQDITDKKRVEEISITDGLTGIYNRRHFNETFPKLIDAAKRKDELLCFLLLDIDHFKQYNDNYGHQRGDEALIKFAACLKESLKRAEDLCFRLGGEEFGLVYKPESKEKALQFANALRENIEAMKIPHKHSKVSDHITASMGLVCKNANDIDHMDEIYKEADELLYASKESGRNRVSINTP